MQTPFLRSENQRLHTIPSPLNNCAKCSRYVKENPPTRPSLLQSFQGLGLATEGSLATLRARHERWCNVWNAEIDSIKPRTIGCLLQDIADWDRERNRVKEAPKIEDANGYVVGESNPCGLCFSILPGGAQGSIHGIDRERKSCLDTEESWGVLTGPLLQIVTM